MARSDGAYLMAPERKRPYAEVALNETDHAKLGRLPDAKRSKIKETEPKSRNSLASSSRETNAAAQASVRGPRNKQDNAGTGKDVVNGSAQTWHHLENTAGAPPSMNWNAGSKANIRISFGRGSVRPSKIKSPQIDNVKVISGGLQLGEQQADDQVVNSTSSNRSSSLQQRQSLNQEESNRVPDLRLCDTVLRASTNDQGESELTATELKRGDLVNPSLPTPIPTNDDANARLDSFIGEKSRYRQPRSDTESVGDVVLNFKTSEDESGEISESESRTFDLGATAKIQADLNFAKAIDSSSESTNEDAMISDSNSNPMSDTTGHGRPPSERVNVQRQVPKLLSELNPDELKLQLRYFYITESPDSVHPSNPVRCLVCAQKGHMAEACNTLTCAVCGKYGQHVTKDCAQVKRCGKCRERGHPASECRRMVRPGHGPPAICDLCQRPGHVEDDCELIWRTSGRPWESDLRTNSIRLGCYECGRSGHLGNDCPTRMPGKGPGTSSWSLNNVRRLSMGSEGGITIKGRATQQKAMALDDSDEDTANFLRPKIPEPSRKGQIYVATQSFGRRPTGLASGGSTGWEGYQGTDVSNYRDNAGYDSRREISPRYSEQGSYRNSLANHPPLPLEEPPGRPGRYIDYQSNHSSRTGESFRPMPSAARHAWIRHRT